MNVLSLFDGMSCGQIALNKLGIKVDNYFASEIDKHAIKVTQSNFPNTIQLGNVIDLKTDKLPKIDLLIGGSPCQSFSNMGTKKGFDGKSGLFFEFLRILKETKPKYFLLENVKMKNDWKNKISEYLKCEPILIDSKLVSAQKRQRLYWTNIPGIEQPKDKNIFIESIIEKHIKHEKKETILKIGQTETGLKIKNNTKQGFQIAENFDSVNLDVPNSKTRRGRVGTKKTNTLTLCCNYGFVFNKEIFLFTITEFERLQTIPDNYTNHVSKNQRKKMIGNGWTVDVICHIFKNIK